MNVSAPILDIIPGPRGLVLTALTRLVGAHTGREWAAQAGVPTATTARILADLVDAGLVEARPAGRAVLYQMKRDHLLSKAVVALATVRFDLVTDLRQQLQQWVQPAVAAWLFGSAARGDGNRESDLDLFLVAEDPTAEVWHKQVGDLADLVERWTGNKVQVVEHTVSSFLALEAERSPLTAALRTDGIELVNGCWVAIATAGQRAK